MRRRGIAKSVGLVIVAVFVVSALVYAILQPATGWPAEDRRLRHPHGFSIGIPKDWEHKIVWGAGGISDSLVCLPSNSVGNPGKLEVFRMNAPAEASNLASRGYTTVQFQGQPAWQHLQQFTKTPDHARSLIFSRDGQWYELLLRRPNSESIEGGVWQAYLDSFRIEPTIAPSALLTVAATQPATTRPATGPS